MNLYKIDELSLKQSINLKIIKRLFKLNKYGTHNCGELNSNI